MPLRIGEDLVNLKSQIKLMTTLLSKVCRMNTLQTQVKIAEQLITTIVRLCPDQQSAEVFMVLVSSAIDL